MSSPHPADALDAFETSLAPLAAPPADGDTGAGAEPAEDIRRWSGRMMHGYRLERLIGQGSSGFVFLARDNVLHRQVAVKVLARREDKADAANARLIGMFVKEARVAATMNHPHSVHIYSVNRLDGWWYMAMEYLEGGTLGDKLRRGGPLPCTEACRHGAEAANALCNAHELGIVHRDVKPGNLMLTRSGHCKVVDFGFAQDPGADGAGRHNLVGTPMYMAPEVIARQRATPKSDVYSLGITLYAVLSGEKPFEAANLEDLYRLHREKMPADLQQLCPHLPAQLCDLVMRMLAKDPAERPAMPAVARALRTWAHLGENGIMAGSLSASTLHALSLSQASAAPPPAKGHAWLPWVVGTGAVAAAAAVVAVVLTRPAAAPAPVPIAPAAATSGEKQELENLKLQMAAMQRARDEEAKAKQAVDAALKAAEDARQAQARLAAETERINQAARAAQEAQTTRSAAESREIQRAKQALQAELLRLESQRSQAEFILRRAKEAESQAAKDAAAKAATLRQQALALLDRARPLEQEATGGRAMTLVEQALALDPTCPGAKETADRLRALYAHKPGARTENSLGMALAWLPAGSFQMGSPAAQAGHQRDETPHQVTLSRPFCIGATEVSAGQFAAVMGKDWKSPDGMPKEAEGANQDPDLPMVFVSWNDAVDFCKRLSEREGRAYRLPTEAEWEYACRAGSPAAFAFGAELPAGLAVAAARPAKCGAGKANAWGLCDMHGNAAEWCADWHAPYAAEAQTDPAGPARPADPDLGARVVRGGSWKQPARLARSGARSFQSPVIKGAALGFRVVLEPLTLESTR